jgi:hypothetical protein
MRKTSPLFVVFLKHSNRCILHRIEDFANIHNSHATGFPTSLSNALQISKLLDCD